MNLPELGESFTSLRRPPNLLWLYEELIISFKTFHTVFDRVIMTRIDHCLSEIEERTSRLSIYHDEEWVRDDQEEIIILEPEESENSANSEPEEPAEPEDSEDSEARSFPTTGAEDPTTLGDVKPELLYEVRFATPIRERYERYERYNIYDIYDRYLEHCQAEEDKLDAASDQPRYEHPCDEDLLAEEDNTSLSMCTPRRLRRIPWICVKAEESQMDIAVQVSKALNDPYMSTQRTTKNPFRHDTTDSLHCWVHATTWDEKALVSKIRSRIDALTRDPNGGFSWLQIEGDYMM